MGLNLVKVCSVCPRLAESSGGLQGSKSVSEGTAGKPVQPVQHADLCHIIVYSSVIVLGLITSGVTPAQQNGCIKQLSALIWNVHNLRIVCKTLRGRIKRCFTYCLQLFGGVFVPCVASRLDVHQKHFFEGGEVLQFPFSVERHIDSGPRQTHRHIKNTSKRLENKRAYFSF